MINILIEKYILNTNSDTNILNGKYKKYVGLLFSNIYNFTNQKLESIYENYEKVDKNNINCNIFLV